MNNLLKSVPAINKQELILNRPNLSTHYKSIDYKKIYYTRRAFVVYI
ncbi:hypothetical protein SAMN05428988_4189 [Chitinophaga sp. YR573]|nr:hypothetical protein SAMN05428988_4189 [Chitinophaga sp. YR573]